MNPVVVNCRGIEPVAWVALNSGPPPPQLTVYRSQISAFTSHQASLFAGLNDDEKRRADRYYQPKDRQRFSIARGLLRLVLGRYTARAPAELIFITDETKKPRLRDFPDLHYNVSHAGDWILMAVSPTGVGVDVEKIDPDFDFRSVAGHVFSREEQQMIAGKSDARPLFYELWTRKEALAKATAKGIDDDFSQLPSVAGDHLVNPRLINTTHNWTISSFVVADAYIGSVAAVTIPVGPESVFCTVDDSLLMQLPY